MKPTESSLDERRPEQVAEEQRGIELLQQLTAELRKNRSNLLSEEDLRCVAGGLLGKISWG